ncbi:nudC domain-containing protein 3 [Cyclospora cayetanensis]|uniref:Nuclear migration protein nudC n=1 Tax=Cyclospora cayetanensis TaxID=88456 RepID=A0A6P6S3W3_9EIME|nr:nudC domain-containing protein 3 [Cyclospora cayetanensis]
MDHEGLLLALARAHKGIAPLLETFFSFLASRTDFFHIIEEGGPSMGFTSGSAEAMIAEAFGQAQLLYRSTKQSHLLPPSLRNRSVQELQKLTRNLNEKMQPARMQYASPVCRLAVLASPPDLSSMEGIPSQATRPAPASPQSALRAPKTAQSPNCAVGADSVSSAGAHEGDKGIEAGKGASPCTVPTDPNASLIPQAHAADGHQAFKPHAKDSSTSSTSNSRGPPSERGKSSFINPWNGAILDRYIWSQSINEATCQLRILELLQRQQQEQQSEEEQQQQQKRVTEVNTKLLSVVLRDDSIRVTYQGQVLFEGKWCHPIRSSESFWVLEQKTFLLLTLEKKSELWWDCLVQGDPTIDTQKIESVKRVEDFDEATQGHIRKLVFEQRLKMQGLKTPEEIHQENILREAWDMEGSPFKGQPFDPNVLRPQAAGGTLPGLLPEGPA